MAALLERADEWDALTAAVGAAGRSRGSVVLVSGEAGIGKTSLVRAFAEHVAGRARRFVGGCDDLLTARPLGPLRDAAAGSGGPLEAALRSGGDVFAAVVAELAGPRVTAVVVEDLHWADDATLDVLGYLARRIADLPAVLVLTYRDEAAATGHPVHRLLGSLVGRRVVRLPLRALSSGAVVGLAAGSDWDPQRLHALTGGNPFYVTEALAQPGSGVPVSVSDAVLARVARLDDDARAAVEQLSVVPTIVGFDLAHTLLGDRLDALAEAEERGIVTSRADGLTFRHELARRAVEQSLAPLRRRTLHRAVVAALQVEAAPDLARLVHHAAAADDGATVSRYAPLAGREAAAAGSHRQALAHFSAALRHGHRLADADLARLVDEHAWELYNAGRFTEALHGGERAVRLPQAQLPATATAPARRRAGCARGGARAAVAAPLHGGRPRRRRRGGRGGRRPARPAARRLAVGAGVRRHLPRRHPRAHRPSRPRPARREHGVPAPAPGAGARHRRRPRGPGGALPQLREPRPPRPRRRRPRRDAPRQPAHRAGERLLRDRGARLHQRRPSSATASTGSTSWSVASPTASPSPRSAGSPPTPTTSPCTAPCWRCGAAGGRRRKRRCARAGRRPSPGCPTPLGRTAGCWPAGRRTPTPA